MLKALPCAACGSVPHRAVDDAPPASAPVAAASGLPAAGAAGQEELIEIPAHGTVFSPCTREYVAVSGIAQVALRGLPAAWDGPCYTLRGLRPGFRGVGVATGVEYGIAEWTAARTDVGPGDEQAIALMVRLVARGRAPDLLARTAVQYALDTNGNLAAHLTDVGSYCLGAHADALWRHVDPSP
jgi:hypothetical protein